MNEPVIQVTNIHLDYPVYGLNKSLRSLILKRKNNTNFIKALNGVDLDINYGDRIGLVGTNGSGKTTLLKTISGIYVPSIGSISIKYSPFTMFDINMGLNLEATGIENIYLISYLRGLSKDQIKAKISAIVEFADLGKFINLPLNTYSNGMKIRLATSIALEINPKILLIDEFFGAGDPDFLKKTRERLKEKINSIHALVFASHNHELINSVCNRIIVMEKGKIIKDIDNSNKNFK